MLDPFLEMMAAERGASAHTLDAYRRDLLDYGAFLRSRGRERLDATPDDIRAYLAGLVAAGMRASTTARRLSALRQYYRFLYLEGRRQDEPTLHIDAPKLTRPLPKLLSEEEIGARFARLVRVQGAIRAGRVELGRGEDGRAVLRPVEAWRGVDE